MSGDGFDPDKFADHDLTTAERLGRRIAWNRRGMDWTQMDLAEVLRRRGLDWSPAIVGLVERGERNLRFAEAVVLVRVLSPSGLSLDDLAEEVPAVETKAERLERERRELEEEWEASK